MVARPRLLINPLERKVLQTLKKYGMIFHGESILVAFSGGPDSVFLLRFLKKFETYLHISVAAVHINHLLRGEAAEQDERFCHTLCEQLQVPLYVIRENVAAVAKKKHISVEEAGHIVRYMHFRRILTEKNLTKLATAHHLNDNSETMLLNIAKGTGLQGLSGIAPILGGNVIRPLIEIEKKDILRYLRKNESFYCTDASNQTDEYQRNYVRNQILPSLKENLNPSIDAALYKLSTLSRDIASYVADYLHENFAAHCTKSYGGGLLVNIEQLKSQHPFIQKELIRAVLLREMDYSASFKDIENIFLLLENQKGREITIKDSIRIIREKESLLIQKQTKLLSVEPRHISIGKGTKIGGQMLQIQNVASAKVVFGSGTNVEYIDSSLIKSELVVRTWKAGDRFIPLGMKGFKKLSDFLTDKKISVQERKRKLVLCHEKDIVWVVGLQIDDRFKITKQTKNILQLTVKTT